MIMIYGNQLKPFSISVNINEVITITTPTENRKKRGHVPTAYADHQTGFPIKGIRLNILFILPRHSFRIVLVIPSYHC